MLNCRAVFVLLLGSTVFTTPLLADDCDKDGIEDDIAISKGIVPDCNNNGIPDFCDIFVNGTSQDCDNDAVPDECEPDCNANGLPDICDIRNQIAQDANGNGIPDTCDIASGTSDDCNNNGVPDEADVRPSLALDRDVYNFTTLDFNNIIDTQVGDMNGDHAPDIVTANRTNSTVGLFLNNGDGTFADGINFALPGHPESVVLSDLDADGDLDVAAAWINAGTSRVTVLRNDGNGGLTFAASYAGGFPSIDVTAGNLGGSGLPDLVVCNQNDSNIAIFPNAGNLVFGGPLLITVGGRPLSTTLADLNDDGMLDIIVSVQTEQALKVFLRQGSFSFVPAAVYPMGDFYTATETEAVDVDHDGDLDLGIAFYYSRNVGIMLNDGAGTFGPIAAFPSAGANPAAITSADFDGDGNVDFAVASSPPYPDGAVSVLRGRGDGTLMAAYSHVIFGDPLSIDDGDFNQDGKPDLAAGSYQQLQMNVFLNTGGTITSADGNHNTIPDECECRADYDGDGFVSGIDFDLFVVAFESGEPEADFDGDGFITGIDFDLYVAAFEAGC